MHVVFGVLSLDVGGLERAVVDLAGAVVARGHRATIVCLERPGQLAGVAEERRATVVALGKLPGLDPRFLGTARDALARLAPDILHTHQIGALYYLGPASPVPVVHTEHGNHVRLARGWWRKIKARLLWRSAGRSATQFCCVSEEIARAVTRWRTVPAGKVAVVPNGVSVGLAMPDAAAVRAEFGLPHAAPVVGTVGRLNEVKRQDLLLRAVAALSRELHDLHALVVGDGPERAALERLAADLRIGDRVRWVGYRSDPERFYPAMDVFALTSRSEGLPVSLLEAWAAGRVVVCSAVGGIPAVVADGENGVLFPSGDVSALVAALRSVLADRAFAARLAAAGHQLVRDRYSLDRVADEYLARYRAVGGRG